MAKLVKDLCRDNGDGQRIEDVIRELYNLALNGKGMVKLEACKYLCDRVAGKPTTTVAGDPDKPLQVQAVELIDTLKALAPR